MKELTNKTQQPVGVRIDNKMVTILPGKSVQIDETVALADRYITGLVNRRVLSMVNRRGK